MATEAKDDQRRDWNQGSKVCRLEVEDQFIRIVPAQNILGYSLVIAKASALLGGKVQVRALDSYFIQSFQN